ncbi:MAG TPA: PGPGW domain-containing protein [Nitrosomonas sp.]|nr:PGPGW domain-containing protein [Nitrosomonas sp.]
MIIRALLTAIGMIIFVIGIILFPMPGPFGIPTMAVGLSIMLKASNRVKRTTISLVHKNRHSSRLWRKIRGLYKRIRC